MDLFINQMYGFVIGVLSSWAFWYFLLILKPGVAISPIATYSKKDGKFRVKIANRGRRQVTDLQVSLAITERRTHKKATPTLNVIHNLQLVKDSLPALAPLQDLNKEWALPAIYTIRSGEDRTAWDLLDSQHPEERRLVFTISMTDAISGTKVVKRVAYGLSKIKFGRFGKDFTVVDDEGDTAERDSGDDNEPN